jgi:CBS domain containing-hemolysin-like protein
VVWFVLLLLTLMLAFFVAAEFAAVSVRESRIQQRSEEGNALARRLLPILRDTHRLDDYIAASQIGITVATLISGAYAQSRLAPALTPLFEGLGKMQTAAAYSAASTVVLIGLTIFQMVVGELIPKSLALQMPTRMALWTVLPMQWSQRLFRWFIRLLNGSGAFILRLIGVRQSGHRHVHSPEEIEFLIAESGRGGVLKPSEQVRLRHALQLGRRPVRDLMVPRVRIVALDVDAPFEEALALATSSPYTRIPVYEESIDYIVGIVHSRDLAVASQLETRPAIRSLMRSPLVLPEMLPADQLLVRFKAARRTMAILVDEFGGTAGLITVDNILDDLIGDIADEFRPVAPTPERLADGRVRLPGSLPVDEAAPWVRASWRKTAATVGGAVAAALGRSPRPGDRVVVDGVEVEVERVEHRAIVSVIARPAGRDRDSGTERTAT